MLRPASTAVCICIASLAVSKTGAVAETGSLSGKALSELVSGSVVEIDTPLGTKIPIHYAETGRISGHAKDLASYLGAPADTGRWWVVDDQICHKWTIWFKGEQQCLRIDKRGSKVNWRSQDGNSGTATIVSRMEMPAVAQTSASTSSPMRAEPAQTARPKTDNTVIASATPRQDKLPLPMRLTPPETLDTAPAAAPPPPAPSVKRPSVVTSAAGSGLVSRSTAAARAMPAVKAPSLAAPAGAASEPAARMPAAALAGNARGPAGPLFKVANVDSDDVLNIRHGPSSETVAVGAIPPDGRGIGLAGECQSGWCPVRHRQVMGWVNRSFLEAESIGAPSTPGAERAAFTGGYVGAGRRDPAFAQRSCLTPPARALIEKIEGQFGPMKLVSTCRAGATIAGTGRPSKHASGNAIDFEAGPRRQQIVDWLIANHHAGGVMTYAGMEHIHVDIGPRFVSLGAPSGGGRHSRRWGGWAGNG